MTYSLAGWRAGPGRVQYLTPRSRWLGLSALTALAVIGLFARTADHGGALAVAGAVVTVAGGAALVGAPERLVLPCAAVAAAGVALLGNAQSSNVGWLAICVLAAWCVLGGRPQAGLLFWCASLLVIGGEWLWTGHDPGWEAWLAGVTFTWLAAAVVRHQLDLVDQLRAAQSGLAERSRAEERNRIAREVHDVIAHTLTVSLLHLSSARLAVEYEPAEAAQALAEAERLCRQSLDEVRGTVGLLRQDASAGSGTDPPVPGIDGVPDLVDRFRLTGADVALVVDGDTGRLPATTGSAIYRILQESLTNTARHAPGASVQVRLTVQAAGVLLVVDSAGAPGHGTGMGLVSMHERAMALRGSCAAGPGGSGWTVRAELPLAGSSAPGMP